MSRFSWKKLRTCSCGLAAMEFALLAPVLLLLCYGTVESVRLLMVHQKAEKVANTIADVVAQSNAVSSSALRQLANAAGQIIAPGGMGDNGVVIISSVYKQGNNAPIVRWRFIGGGTLSRSSQIGGVNGPANLPGGLTLNDKDNIIVAEVYYRYTTSVNIGNLIGGDLYKVAIYKPRLGALITPPT